MEVKSEYNHHYVLAELEATSFYRIKFGVEMQILPSIELNLDQ
jgi:hypothetical protein